MTKVFAKHEMRTGMDFVRLELNHRQAEWGSYGLKGGFAFSGNTTGAFGYTSPGWNSYAALPDGVGELLLGGYADGRDDRPREPVRVLRPRPLDREPKLTLSGGLRLEYYPLMSRVGRGIETLDYNTLRRDARRHRRPAR